MKMFLKTFKLPSVNHYCHTVDLTNVVILLCHFDAIVGVADLFFMPI